MYVCIYIYIYIYIFFACCCSGADPPQVSRRSSTLRRALVASDEETAFSKACELCVCVCICMYVCIYIYIYYIYTCTRATSYRVLACCPAWQLVCVYMCVYTHTHTYTHAHTHTHAHTLHTALWHAAQRDKAHEATSRSEGDAKSAPSASSIAALGGTHPSVLTIPPSA